MIITKTDWESVKELAHTMFWGDGDFIDPREGREYLIWGAFSNDCCLSLLILEKPFMAGAPWMLNLVATHPTVQGKGLPTQVFNKLVEKEFFGDCPPLKTYIDTDNIPSMRWHISLGFKPIAREEFFLYFTEYATPRYMDGSSSPYMAWGRE